MTDTGPTVQEIIYAMVRMNRRNYFKLRDLGRELNDIRARMLYIKDHMPDNRADHITVPEPYVLPRRPRRGASMEEVLDFTGQVSRAGVVSSLQEKVRITKVQFSELKKLYHELY